MDDFEDDWWEKHGAALLWSWEHFLRRFWRARANPVLDWEMDERLERIRLAVRAEISRQVDPDGPLPMACDHSSDSRNDAHR